MSNLKENKTKSLNIPLIIVLILLLATSSMLYYFYLSEKNKAKQFVKQYTDDMVIKTTNVLHNPQNCLKNLRDKNLTSGELNQILNEEESLYKVDSFLKDSKIKILKYSLTNSAEMLAKNTGVLNVTFVNETDDLQYNAEINLYLEVNQQDQLEYCQALSSSITELKEKALLNSFRVKHASAIGILAKHDGVQVSIAAASCPSGYLMTGCNGASETQCIQEAIAPFKIGPQTLNPHTCEVWAKATERCQVQAIATAICLKAL